MTDTHARARTDTKHENQVGTKQVWCQVRSKLRLGASIHPACPWDHPNGMNPDEPHLVKWKMVGDSERYIYLISLTKYFMLT